LIDLIASFLFRILVSGLVPKDFRFRLAKIPIFSNNVKRISAFAAFELDLSAP